MSGDALAELTRLVCAAGGLASLRVFLAGGTGRSSLALIHTAGWAGCAFAGSGSDELTANWCGEEAFRRCAGGAFTGNMASVAIGADAALGSAPAGAAQAGTTVVVILLADGGAELAIAAGGSRAAPAGADVALGDGTSPIGIAGAGGRLGRLLDQREAGAAGGKVGMRRQLGLEA